MNRLARWMIRLYPASWQARYGDEMEALLSDAGADARTVGDLARGCVRMQLKAWPFPLLALVLGLTGVLAGAGVSFLMPNRYMSRATLRVENTASRAAAIEEITRLRSAVTARMSLARMINQVGLYPDRLQTTPLEDVIEEMRRDIRIDLATSPKHPEAIALAVRFEYGDRLKAQQSVAALVTAFEKEFAAPLMGLHILDAPSLPQTPVKPNRPLIAVAGGFLGLAMATIISLARRRWRRMDSIRA
jgi:LPS O-antigen subunit length determinant protein (WzzB/FepE family)